MIKFTEEELAIWEQVFKPKLYDKKGLNKKQVMKYLLNAHKAMQEVMKVYHHVTNGLIMNFATPANDVITVITELDNKNLEQILKDEKEKWTKDGASDTVEVEKVQDTCLVRIMNKLNQFYTSFEVTVPVDDEVKKFPVVWDSKTQTMQLKANKQLPNEWQPVAIEAIKWLMNSPEKKELLVTK